MTWYELIPTPSPLQGGDDRTRQAALRSLAQDAAAALRLSSTPSLDTITDALRRDDGIVLVATPSARYVCLPDGADPSAASALAAACESTARECDGPAIPPGLVWAHAFAPGRAGLSRTARERQEDGETSRLEPPEDGLVAVNVRRRGFVETRRNKDWLGDEFNMSPDASKLQEPGCAVCRVVCAAPGRQAATDGAVRAAGALNIGMTPGFAAHVSRPGSGLVVCSALLLVLFAALAVLLSPWLWISALAPLVLLGYALWRRRGMGADADVWQRPRHYWNPRARMRRADPNDVKTRLGGDDAEAAEQRRGRLKVHGYAFQRSTLPVPSSTLASLCRPPAGAVGASQEATASPAVLTGADGPRLGVDSNGDMAHLPSSVMYGGVFDVGGPGGGKSNLLHGLERWIAEHMGAGDLMVVFESKGADSWGVLHRLIPSARLVDIAADHGPMVSLLGPGTPAEQGERFASLMRGALGDAQVGPASRLYLSDAVRLALEAPGRDGFARACRAGGVGETGGWTDLAFTLLCGHGADAARRLAHVMVLTGSPAMAQAVERLHGGTNPRTGRPLVNDGELVRRLSAPMNKMSVLAGSPTLTDPSRPSISWASALRHCAKAPTVLVVNLGPSVDGLRSLPSDAATLAGQLLFTSMKDAIESHCAGWQGQGRHVHVAVDELTGVLGADPTEPGGNADAFEWLRSRGRAYGVELMAGTQYPEQLDRRTLALVMGFDTKCAFALHAATSAATVGEGMGVDAARIGSLGRHTMLVSTLDPDGHALPTFAVEPPHFDAGE